MAIKPYRRAVKIQGTIQTMVKHTSAFTLFTKIKVMKYHIWDS